MKMMFLSVIAATAFAVSSVAFAASGCGGFQTVSTPEPITTVDTDTSTSTSDQSQDSG